MATRTARGVLIAVLVVVTMLLLLDIRGTGPGQTLRWVAGAIAGPPARALAWVRTEAEARLGGATDEQARIAQLEQELLEARAALGQRAAAQAGAAAAEALASLLPVTGYRLVPGRVVTRSAPQDLRDAVTIAVGSSSGVAPGMLVIDSAGAVGVVASASPGLSTLRLITDPANRLAARVIGSQEAGILQGSGAHAAALTLLDPLGAMAVGDRVVTIGTVDALVPADLPLGSITAITGSAAALTRTAHVDPRVDPSTLDRVAVLVPRTRP